MNRPRIQIIRGLPGSGKSSLANEKWPHLLRYEFDFFCMRGGCYSFGNRRNVEGQVWLMYMIEDAMKIGLDLVVPGVFAYNGESLSRLVALALDYGYDVWLETLDNRWGNVHNVREADYLAMQREFVDAKTLSASLCDEFGNNPHIKFGCMPSQFEVIPMEDGK